MATVAEIQQAIEELSEGDYAQLIDWLQDRRQDEWDHEIEEDALAGALDFLRAEVEQARKDGTLREL